MKLTKAQLRLLQELEDGDTGEFVWVDSRRVRMAMKLAICGLLETEMAVAKRDVRKGITTVEPVYRITEKGIQFIREREGGAE